MRPSKLKCYFNIIDHHKVGPHKEYRYFSFLESKELWTKIKVWNTLFYVLQADGTIIYYPLPFSVNKCW